MKTEFKVVSAENGTNFAHAIGKAFDDSWEPVGGMSHTIRKDTWNGDVHLYEILVMRQSENGNFTTGRNHH